MTTLLIWLKLLLICWVTGSQFTGFACTITSFLSIALFFDMLEMYIKSNFVKPVDTAVGFSGEELAVVGLFTLQHCFLFLYPCFKAAAVTVGREKLIKKVNALKAT